METTSKPRNTGETPTRWQDALSRANNKSVVARSHVAPGPAAPPAYETPFILERCRRCDGFGDMRVSLSGRLDDYRVQPCGMCKGDGEIAVPNPMAAFGR